MPLLKTYRIFISHAWAYNADYYRLEEMLNDAELFYWQNYSVPEHDPAPNNALVRSLRNQIRPTNIVIILSGMYATYSDWIQREIKIALEIEKPILGIYPWGSQRAPLVVQEAADEMVGWNTNSIVSAIRRLAL
ncbi:MAG: TIR domain-containing protein [Candidatus Bathyarchaeota archaeon]